ncbi:Mif2/CENP-C like-domain-containing protein, partial [Mycena sp. CBHHK59/15]
MPSPSRDARSDLAPGARSNTHTTAAAAGSAGTGRVSCSENIVDNIVVDVDSSEEGRDAERGTRAVVKEYTTGDCITRRIAFTPNMFKPLPANNNEWLFQKIFGDRDYIAAGQILIPPKGCKPRKSAKDNTLIFLVIEGMVNLKVCEASIIVVSGGMFMIPRGNTYLIENNADRDAKLFFTQARRTSDEGDEDMQLKFERIQKDLETERRAVAKQNTIIVNLTEKLQIAREELQAETERRKAAEAAQRHAEEAQKAAARAAVKEC